MVEDLRSSSTSFDITSFQKSPSIGGKSGHTSGKHSFSDAEFVNRLHAGRSTSIRATSYPLGDLQTATANFASGRLLGQGSIGRVYRAKYADGKVPFALYIFVVATKYSILLCCALFLKGNDKEYPQFIKMLKIEVSLVLA